MVTTTEGLKQNNISDWIFFSAEFDGEIIDRVIMTSIPCTKDGKNAYGFVYKLQFINGMQYIGKKAFYAPNGKESNWKRYLSSSDKVKLLVASGKFCTRMVLSVATTKTELSYMETYQLFKNRVLDSSYFLNDNIEGKWYRGKTK